MVIGRIRKEANPRVVCPECKKWFKRNTMVLVRYGVTATIEVCPDCYEEKYFVPPAPLKKEKK